jgi:hypothetical protein
MLKNEIIIKQINLKESHKGKKIQKLKKALDLTRKTKE